MDINKRTEALLLADEFRMKCLKAAFTLNLPDWYLAAGFVRNAIWDHLHNKTEMTPLNDVDLVYFDSEDLSHTTELHYQSELEALFPHVNWEVRNQARMHRNHGHLPYKSSEHAIAHWVEIPTCAGVRLEPDNRMIFCSPFGLKHNWSLEVEMNPHFPQPDVFIERVSKKQWLTIWPNLKLINESSIAEISKIGS